MPVLFGKWKHVAGLVTKGIVITKLTNNEKQELSKFKKIGHFVAGKKVINKWIQINTEANEFPKVLPFINKSYERALTIKS